MKNIFTKAMLLTSALVFSSQQADAMVDFGIKGGLGMSKGSFDPAATGTTFEMGYLGGASVTFGLGPVGIMADVLYAKRKISTGTNAAIGTTDIVIPVQAKFSLMPMLFLSGGMYYALNLGDEVTAYSGDASLDVTYDTANLNKGDFGIVAGLGASLPLGVTTLTVEGRYNMGLKNRSTGSGVTAKANHIDLLVGVTF